MQRICPRGGAVFSRPEVTGKCWRCGDGGHQLFKCFSHSFLIADTNSVLLCSLVGGGLKHGGLLLIGSTCW